MINLESKIPVPGELQSVTVDGKIVSTSYVYDEDLAKKQKQINSEVTSSVNELEERISQISDYLDTADVNIQENKKFYTLKPEPDAYLRNVHYDITDQDVSLISKYTNSNFNDNRFDQPLPIKLLANDFIYIYESRIGDRPFDSYTPKSGVVQVYNLVPGRTYFIKDKYRETISSFTVDSSRRFIYADQVQNVRDLGGIPVEGGGYIAYDKIIRGSELKGKEINANSSSINKIKNLNITLDVDLRNTDERLVSPNPIGQQYINVHGFPNYYDINSLSSFHKQNIKTAFEAVVNEVLAGGKVYMHCAWGYHRCGFLASIIEGILGAKQCEIDKDYELSSFSSLGNVSRTDGYYKVGILALKSKYNGSWINLALDCGIEQETIDAFRNVMIVDISNNTTIHSQYYNVTYDELVSLRNSNQLVPGAKYRMIDFDTCDDVEFSKANCSGISDSAEFKSAYHHFDLLLTALSTNELDCNVKALHSVRDTEGYFTNNDLSKWELKYDLDNDKSKYSWADDKGKGVIYYMKDENNNEVPYDFKNILFKYRTEILPTNHEYVDLGLPSGTLWATCNIGADSPEEFGNYFAWGETKPKNMYDINTYFDTEDGGDTFKKYNNDGGLTELQPEDDAATAIWGDSWQMPSYDQINELINDIYTTTEWTTQNGVYGRKITSRSNDNYIFLPAAGFQDNTDLIKVGIYGSYCSSSLNAVGSSIARYLDFHSSYIGWSYSNRYYGQNVRPVTMKQVKNYISTFNGEAYNNIIKPYIDNLGQHLNKNIFITNSYDKIIKDNFIDNNSYNNIFIGNCIGCDIKKYFSNNKITNAEICNIGNDCYNLELVNAENFYVKDECYNLYIEKGSGNKYVIVPMFTNNRDGLAVGEQVIIKQERDNSSFNESFGYIATYNDGTTIKNRDVSIIDENTIINKENLKSIVIGDNITSIGSSAFSNCTSLTSVTIPNSVTSIDDIAFSGCYNLTSITVKSTTPPTLGSNVIPSNVTHIYVPSESVEAYKAASGWSQYASIIEAVVE